MVDDVKEGIIVTELKTGLYKHYKGRKYLLFCIAEHSETQETLCVYKESGGTSTKIWARPSEMFQQYVVLGGTHVPRFKFLRAIRAAEIDGLHQQD